MKMYTGGAQSQHTHHRMEQKHQERRNQERRTEGEEKEKGQQDLHVLSSFQTDQHDQEQCQEEEDRRCCNRGILHFFGLLL